MSQPEPQIREVRDEQSTRGLEIQFTVDVPPEPLLEIFWEPENFSRLFPDIQACRVLHRDGTTLEAEFRVDARIRVVEYTLRRTLDREAGSITWQELSGDLRRVRGGWWASPGVEPGTSRVTYRAFVDIGRFVPTRLVVMTARRKAAEMVDRVRRVAVELHTSDA